MPNQLLTFTLLLALFLSGMACQRTSSPVEVEVLVLGGGTGGTAAGIQAARQGVRTLLVEPTPWLGGMLTAAGVSAIDGNHHLPAGLWGEFREALYDHYGGPEAVATGWVSLTQFEPHVGADILLGMAQKESKLEVWLETGWSNIQKKEGYWSVTVNRKGSPITVHTEILIDGTDLGDVADAAGAAYEVGMDARDETGEMMAPPTANDIIQDLTYVAILKDYGSEADRTIARPDNYDPAEFHCSCIQYCDGSYDLPCDQMLTYGKLPNDKYMINWPNQGNDYYANVVEMTPEERRAAYEAARQQTRRFVYYIQHELGYAHLGLADDEFPTEDSLALIPYHREGRRIDGLVRLDVNDISAPYSQPSALYRTGIAVGDYPIDHHHDKNPEAPEINFPPVPSFSIPAGSLIPAGVDHLLIADKPISVTNIVNGSTRLQPVVLQIGQVAGLMAALAARQEVTPKNLDVRQIQDTLLAHRGYLRPYYDVGPDDPHFQAIQRAGAAGLLRGTGEPYQWANRTWFYPESPLSGSALRQGWQTTFPEVEITWMEDEVPLEAALAVLLKTAGHLGLEGRHWDSEEALSAYLSQQWAAWELTNYAPDRPLTRVEWAVLTHHLLDPFHRKPVDWTGRFLENLS